MSLGGATCSFCGRDLWEVERHVASSRARICSDCVEAGARAIDRARAEGRPATEAVRLDPRVLGSEPPDEHAVGAVVDVVVETMRFTSDDVAEVRFAVLLGAGGFPFEGRAVRRDGRWLVRRETFCHLMRMAGVTCPPEGGHQP